MGWYMKVWVLILLAVGVYGYWGLFTKSGEKAYTGMTALFPFYALAGCIVLSIVTFVLYESIRLYAQNKRDMSAQETPEEPEADDVEP
jgi:hypothetical protein